MSLLHQDSPEAIDDAALGEEFTKGTSHLVWASLIAAVLMTVAVAIYVVAGEKKPVVAGEIVQVWAHPRHVETSGIDASGAPMAKQSFDEVLIFARVKLKNQIEYPLVMQDVLANATLADGIDSISAGSAAQYDEVFLAYPEVAALRGNPLSSHATIAPGESLDGNAFWIARLNKQAWDARKNLDFTFKFQYQSSVVLAPHTAVMEQ